MKKYLKRNEGFTLEEYNDGTSVLLNSNSGIVHLLNTTASLLYKLCKVEIEKDILFNKFLGEIDLSSSEFTSEDIRSDFENVIKDFLDKGILINK